MKAAKNISSKLTIMRVPSAAAPQCARERVGGGSSRSAPTAAAGRLGRPLALALARSQSEQRVSFAGGSSLRQRTGLAGPPAPTNRSASSSPHRSHPSQTRLSPQQVYNAARRSYSSPAGPVGALALSQITDEILLPFLDRPTEVASLFSAGPNARLLALFSHIFPSNNSDVSLANSPGPAGAEMTTSLDFKVPEEWTFADLRQWLTSVSRSEVGDALWVQTLRRAILAHSELLWERVKAVLGIPFEFDAQGVSAQHLLPDDALMVESLRSTSLHISESDHHDLTDIAEDAEDRTSQQAVDAIIGLRFSTSLTPSHPVPPPPPPTRQSSLRAPFRSISQNTIPLVSSPLAGRSKSVIESGVKGGRMVGGKPLFPASFANLSTRLQSVRMA